MCGFAGALHRGPSSSDWEDSLRAMGATIAHRGPDGEGVWHDAAAGIGVVHRRLAVVDRSSDGHQPMLSPGERYVLVYNGEIYNHAELREALLHRGCSFRGHSDTEVLLTAICEWGVERSLQRCVGMFAFALWDRETRKLVLARDRIGEKPLYYGWQGRAFLFGSELRALRAHSAFGGQIDRGALTTLVRHNYVPAPHSIYSGISKLRPGTYLELDGSLSSPPARIEPVAYWSLARVVLDGQRDRFSGSDEEATDELERLLKQAVGQQMLADVPVGAFLSGGVDSSTIVALMQSLSSRPVKTFTIGFEQPSFDESTFAGAVADHLGTDHTCLKVGAQEALGVVPQLGSLWDEPFSDSSQIPTYLVSKLARGSVTVSLSGDAGDELFCGYPRFEWTHDLWRVLGRIPVGLRRAAGTAAHGVPSRVWEHLFELVAPILPAAVRQRRLGDKVHGLATLLKESSREQVYRRVVSHGGDPEATTMGSKEPPTVLTQPRQWPTQECFFERMMFLDMMSYLPDDILVKVDRAAMAASLETRVPLLDHRIVEFVWKLPLSVKRRAGQRKWLLRQVLYRHVPRHLIERPKVGFGVPLADWLRGPLREWAEAELDPRRLEKEGFFNTALVRQKWDTHQSGRGTGHAWLWNVLMFQSWYGRWHSR